MAGNSIVVKRKQAEEDLKNLETKAKEIKLETEQTIMALNNEPMK